MITNLSPVVASALDSAADVSTWMGSHHPGEVQATRNARLAAPYFAIAMDHREAILLLVAHGSRSAAFALLRSVFESFFSGLWAQQVADHSHFDEIAKRRALPTFERMIQQLDRKEPGSKEHRLAARKQEVWKMMSDFAHSGLAQLSRWFSPEGIGQRHTDQETVELLFRVNVYGLLACRGACELAGMDLTAHDAYVLQYVDSFPARKP